MYFATTGDAWGLSEIGVDGNDLLRSSDVRVYNEYISAFRFEFTIDALSILTSCRLTEADVTVSTQVAPSKRSEDAKLVQLFLGFFVGVKISQRLAVRNCTMTCELWLVLISCGTGERASDISAAFALSGSS